MLPQGLAPVESKAGFPDTSWLLLPGMTIDGRQATLCTYQRGGTSIQKVLVSRYLLDHLVRYDDGSRGPFDLLSHWYTQGRIVALCPEVTGDLPTPRPPAEVPDGQDGEVLDRLNRVFTIGGGDVSEAFLLGAEATVELIRRHDVQMVVLKARSPSRDSLENYDGRFSGNRVAGEDVTTAALKRMGVLVFNGDELGRAAVCLAGLDADG